MYRSTKPKSEEAHFATMGWTFCVTHGRLLQLQ